MAATVSLSLQAVNTVCFVPPFTQLYVGFYTLLLCQSSSTLHQGMLACLLRFIQIQIRSHDFWRYINLYVCVCIRV